MTNYNVIHFEALGKEADFLKDYTEKAIAAGNLPADWQSLIVPETIDTFLAANKDFKLPNIITIKTHSKIPESYFGVTKKSVITRSAGYDHCDSYYQVANVASLREYCIAAVAQTAIKFTYETAGYTNEYLTATTTFERKKVPSFFELNKNSIATVFGVGKIGKKIYDLLVANDLTVQAVDTRAEELAKLAEYKNVKFVNKEDAINSDILVCAMNLTKNPASKFYNIGYFSEAYLQSMQKSCFFINITRGEIAYEDILLKLYDSGKIIGLGLDVFSDEAIVADYLNNKTSTDKANVLAAKELIQRALAHSANIYVQPHQAFNSNLAAESKAKEALNHIIAWYKNKEQFFDEQLPYYTD